ncbi:hypothetical protein B0H14DRAFT_3516454 [Mycena olivaceomarginata]|nr:hypothetical protein B0H14DRAFT_3516454 [Mycena olivaceomarginata]
MTGAAHSPIGSSGSCSVLVDLASTFRVVEPLRATSMRGISVPLHASRLLETKEYPGRLSFATDAWTSPNHRAFVAWTVHLHHEGHPLAPSLDIYEVPESHTGEVLAREKNTVLALDPNNSYEAVNRVRCFNHTLNLAVKSFLRPFLPPEKMKKAGATTAPTPSEDNVSDVLNDLDEDIDDDMPDLADAPDSGFDCLWQRGR